MAVRTLARRFLAVAIAAATMPATADTVSLYELPAPDGYAVAAATNIAADGTVVGVVYPTGSSCAGRHRARPKCSAADPRSHSTMSRH